MKRRTELLSGKCPMPVIKELKGTFKHEYSVLERCFDAMWLAYLNKGTKGVVSSPYWSQRVSNPLVFNLFQQALSQAGWISSYAHTAWGEMSIQESKLLEFVDREELDSIRQFHKFNQFKLDNPTHRYCDNVVQNGKVTHTLARPGANLAAATQFQFDTGTMREHYSLVLDQTIKGIDKVSKQHPQLFEDTANYLDISDDIIDYYMFNPENKYSAGTRTSDSRGRNISAMLAKIGNPIGFKVFRALLVIPEESRNVATKRGLENAYLFIAELLGFKGSTVAQKIQQGRQYYYSRTLPEYDTSTEHSRKELFEHIWLERLYQDLDRVLGIVKPSVKHLLMSRYQTGEALTNEEVAFIETFNGVKWSVPVEIDMGASILGIIGAFLDDTGLMAQSNILPGKLQKSWNGLVDIDRNLIKVVMRKLYGSAQSMEDIWKEEKLHYTSEDSIKMAKALETGPLAVAAKFRDFLINNATMKPTMSLDVHDETLLVECNKHHNVGDVTTKYHFYNSDTKLTETVANTHTHKEPDLDQFRRWVVTGLIHNRDSIIEDNTIKVVCEKFGWGLDLYDAIICCPEAVDTARQAFADGIDHLRANRTKILTKYFASIGIPTTAKQEWDELMSLVAKPTENFKCNPMVLK